VLESSSVVWRGRECAVSSRIAVAPTVARGVYLPGCPLQVVDEATDEAVSVFAEVSAWGM
jgi:hypothetical protein